MAKGICQALARVVATGTLLWSCLTSAQATQHDLILSGVVGNGQVLSQDFAGNHYDQWFLDLSGLPDSPLPVAEGDTLLVNLTLDQPLTIPGGYPSTTLLLYLQNREPPSGNFPDVPTSVSGTANFYLAGQSAPAVPDPLFVSGSTRAQLAAGRGWPKDTYGDLTFDQLVLTLTIDALPSPATITNAQLSYSLVAPLAAPVPEPAEWALLASGLAVVGLARRRRTSARACGTQAMPC